MFTRDLPARKERLPTVCLNGKYDTRIPGYSKVSLTFHVCHHPSIVILPIIDACFTITMNWTGGSLQRHSKKAQKSIVAKQREHFAKLRTALQEEPGAPVAPFRPGLLDHAGALPPFGARSVRHAGHPKTALKQEGRTEECEPRKGRRRTRDEPENGVPLPDSDAGRQGKGPIPPEGHEATVHNMVAHVGEGQNDCLLLAGSKLGRKLLSVSDDGLGG